MLRTIRLLAPILAVALAVPVAPVLAGVSPPPAPESPRPVPESPPPLPESPEPASPAPSDLEDRCDPLDPAPARPVGLAMLGGSDGATAGGDDVFAGDLCTFPAPDDLDTFLGRDADIVGDVFLATDAANDQVGVMAGDEPGRGARGTDMRSVWWGEAMLDPAIARRLQQRYSRGPGEVFGDLVNLQEQLSAGADSTKVLLVGIRNGGNRPNPNRTSTFYTVNLALDRGEPAESSAAVPGTNDPRYGYRDFFEAGFYPTMNMSQTDYLRPPPEGTQDKRGNVQNRFWVGWSGRDVLFAIPHGLDAPARLRVYTVTSVAGQGYALDVIDAPGGPTAGLPITGLTDPAISCARWDIGGGQEGAPGYTTLTVRSDEPVDGLLGQLTFQPQPEVGDPLEAALETIAVTYDEAGFRWTEIVVPDAPSGRLITGSDAWGVDPVREELHRLVGGVTYIGAGTGTAAGSPDCRPGGGTGAPVPGSTAGDFNGDGTVDSDDYNVWRATFGQTVPAGGPPGADGDGNGVVDAADYVVWRNAQG